MNRLIARRTALRTALRTTLRTILRAKRCRGDRPTGDEGEEGDPSPREMPLREEAQGWAQEWAHESRMYDIVTGDR